MTVLTAIPAASPLLARLACLRLCRFAVTRANGPASLSDAAAAAGALRSAAPAAVAGIPARLFALLRR